MKAPSFLSVAVSIGVATAALAGPTPNPRAEAVREALFTAASAEPDDCLSGEPEFGEVAIAWCGRLRTGVDARASAFREGLDAALSKFELTWVSDWHESKWVGSRVVWVEDTPLLLRIDRRRERILVEYPAPAGPPCMAPLPAQSEQDFVPPVRTSSEKPRPSQPRANVAVRFEGVVFLQVVVKADGSVGAACVREESKLPMLFGPAFEFVRGWHYRPGMLAGTPVDSVRDVAVVFRAHSLGIW